MESESTPISFDGELRDIDEQYADFSERRHSLKGYEMAAFLEKVEKVAHQAQEKHDPLDHAAMEDLRGKLKDVRHWRRPSHITHFFRNLFHPNRIRGQKDTWNKLKEAFSDAENEIGKALKAIEEEDEYKSYLYEEKMEDLKENLIKQSKNASKKWKFWG